MIAPQQLCSHSENNSSNDSDKIIVAQEEGITNEMKACQKPCETALFMADDIIEEDSDAQARFNEPMPDFNLDSAPSTPQLIQATRADISLDGSHHSDDCACTKSEMEKCIHGFHGGCYPPIVCLGV